MNGAKRRAFGAFVALLACAATASPLAAAPATFPGPIAAIHIKLLGAETGKFRDLSPVESGEIRDLKAGDPRLKDDGPIKVDGGPGQEAYSGFLVDVELRGTPKSVELNANLAISVYFVPYREGMTVKPDSVLIAQRLAKTIAFGPSGVAHEALFVPGRFCGDLGIEAELQTPPAAEIAKPSFDCGE